ncbi:MAG: glycosyltransferase family 2 protein [Bacteroidales bacterium]|nr:glycosyltransferase family 2 protein [Bacteroidales bacterium]
MKRDKDSFISIIIPSFNEEDNILFAIENILRSIIDFPNYEVIFVDDGSTDNSLIQLREAKRNNRKVKYISFSRNFGHQNALRAGIRYAQGDCIISLDADMQQPPELIPKLISKWMEGYDVVYTIRKDTKKVFRLKQLTSRIFYSLLNALSDIKIDRGSADYRLIDRKVANCLNNMEESNIFFRSMIRWIGFKNISIEYNATTRLFGKTKYGIKKMSALALTGITGFSLKPLRISTFIGLSIAFLSVLYGMYAVYLKLFTEKSVDGWSSILFMISFIGGIQLVMIGVLGEYIGRIFMESKNRPNYIIEESDLN